MAASKKSKKTGGKDGGKNRGKGRNPQKRKKVSAPLISSQNARIVRIVLGLVFALMAIYTLATLISYIFTWKSDLSLSTSPELLSSGQVAQNVGGLLGFKWANLLISKLFGFGAFTIPVFFAALAVYCFRIKPISILRVFILSLFGAIIFSVFFAYIFSFFNSSLLLNNGAGGSYGHHACEWLCNALGRLGAGCVILVALFLWGVLFSRKVAYWFDDLIYNTSHREKEESSDDEEDEFPEPEKDDDYNEEEDVDLPSVRPAPVQLKDAEADLYPDEEEDLQEADDAAYKAALAKLAQESEDNVPEQAPEQGTDSGAEWNVQVEVSDNDFVKNASEEEMARLYDPRLDLPKYKFPPMSILNDYRDKWYEVSRDELEKNKQRIVNALANYKIKVVGITAKMGPTVTLYKIHLADGIKIAQVRRLEEDIALSLGAKGVRVVTLLDSVGIEVPNEKASVVALKSILNSQQFQDANMELPLAMGITVTNEPFFIDLAKMPHLLVAGATGMGKSVGLNCIIASLLYTKHPAEMKLVLVDPKKVELSLYSKLEKHFLAMLPDGEEAIITDTKKVVETLKSLCIEMDNRYDLLKKADVRQLKEYNKKFLDRKLNPEHGHQFLPYIVVIIDEFADLLMTAGREVEEPIARLAQKARAVGIHLVIATQRPTTDIITGTIKANFNSRIAFKVNSMVDSRTILDSPGANRLIGRGDMLVLHPGADLTRVQCALIDTPEIIDMTKYIADQRGYSHAFYLPEYVDESEDGGTSDVDLRKRDKLFEEAAKIVVQYQQGSTSLIQRKLEIGYNRAGRLIDQLEAAGIVGPFEGSKARSVLISDFDTLDRKLESLDHQTII
jgi:DNA segregation ATPase FtsK/SpoIIIE and related proteins